jgi:hypothetical protein
VAPPLTLSPPLTPISSISAGRRSDPVDDEREFDPIVMDIAKRSHSPTVIAVGLLVAATGCGHSGITVEANNCSSAAAALDPTETEVLTAAAHHLYDRGELKISQETALTGFWSPYLLPIRMGKRTFGLGPAVANDQRTRNAQPGCLRLPQDALAAAPNAAVGTQTQLTLSRPGFDRRRHTAIVVYRKAGQSSSDLHSGLLVLRHATPRGWSVSNGVAMLP